MSDMQSQDNLFFVRQEMVAESPPPVRVRGVWP